VRGLEILIEVKPERRQEFVRAIEWLVERENSVQKSVTVSVYEQHGSPNHFLWVEHWPSDSELNKRLHSEPFQALQGAIQVLGKLTKMSVVDVENQSNYQERGQ
jgi:quinol monooxygenase YgiN